MKLLSILDFFWLFWVFFFGPNPDLRCSRSDGSGATQWTLRSRDLRALYTCSVIPPDVSVMTQQRHSSNLSSDIWKCCSQSLAVKRVSTTTSKNLACSRLWSPVHRCVQVTLSLVRERNVDNPWTTVKTTASREWLLKPSPDSCAGVVKPLPPMMSLAASIVSTKSLHGNVFLKSALALCKNSTVVVCKSQREGSGATISEVSCT